MSAAPPDVYDHEIIEIEKVLEGCKNSAAKGGKSVSEFSQEFENRFAEIGFRIVVNWYYTDHEGVVMPEITINGRVEDHAFDHDRQVHEVVSNVLDLPGQEGWISTKDKRPDTPGHKH